MSTQPDHALKAGYRASLQSLLSFLLLSSMSSCCHAQDRSAAEFARQKVHSDHIDPLFAKGAVVIRNGLRDYVFNEEDRLMGAAAMAATFYDSPGVCLIGPNETSICPTTDIVVGIVLCCPAILPPQAAAITPPLSQDPQGPYDVGFLAITAIEPP